MARTINFTLTVIFLTFLSSPAWGQVTVPNTFSAGTPGVAADVNANFQAVVDGINAINSSSTPLDDTYRGRQYSATDTGGTRNVVVLRAIDPNDNNNSFYSVRVSYQNGTVDVSGTPTTFTYVRENARIITIAGTVSSATNRREGTNDTSLGGNSFWNYEWITYDPVSAVPTVVSNQGERRFRCHNPSVSGMVRNCWRQTRDPSGLDPAGSPTMIVNRSRIASVTTGSFDVGSLTFANGGAVVSFLSNAIGLNYARVAKDVGVVLETRTDAGPTNDQRARFFVLYYRIEGFDGGAGVGVAVGSLIGTPFIGAPWSGVFFTE